jgi:hypothetical protein
MSIKAIETSFKGYRMRSRLEARWAVFFDALGIEWDYEREGYQVEGLFYLPDFYFPKFIIEKPAIIEIKPELPPADSEEGKKIMALTKAMHPDTAVFVLVGSPDPQRPVMMFHIVDDNISGMTIGSIDDPKHNMLCLIGFNPETGGEQVVVSQEGVWKITDSTNALWLGMSERITSALTKARAARFEHGEKG